MDMQAKALAEVVEHTLPWQRTHVTKLLGDTVGEIAQQAHATGYRQCWEAVKPLLLSLGAPPEEVEKAEFNIESTISLALTKD